MTLTAKEPKNSTSALVVQGNGHQQIYAENKENPDIND
jgi:hypothetical protein